MKKIRSLIPLLLSISLISGLVTPQFAGASKHKPTLKQIEAAKQIEEEKRKITEEATKLLVREQQGLKRLVALALVAKWKYLSAKNELQVATKQSARAAKIYSKASVLVSETHRQIGKLAVNAYVVGSGFTDLEAILSASGPQEMMDRISTLENLGSGNKTALNRFQAAEEVAQRAKIAANLAKEKQALITIKVASAKMEADAAEAEQQKEVDKLQAVQDQLQRDLASAKKVRITLEQKRQLAILEEARSIEAGKVKGQAKIWKTGGPNGKSTFRTTEAQRLKAVEFAKKQVLANKPYVWGDEGPDSFDCSGLVYAAYKYAGLGWPIWDRLNSGLYYTYTKQIPLSEIQPGDLIFYSYKGTISTIHHMSIYAGNGMVWEARSTKSGLRYSDMYGMDGMMPYAGRV
ncbi:MAG: NlpC/P60 family protein [Candidatus Planktophila sp.]|nr:NlpC/P60 family protein [Candidatus Planktophila sp.]